MPASTVESIWIFYQKNQYLWARKVYSPSVNQEQALTVLKLLTDGAVFSDYRIWMRILLRNEIPAV